MTEEKAKPGKAPDGTGDHQARREGKWIAKGRGAGPHAIAAWLAETAGQVSAGAARKPCDMVGVAKYLSQDRESNSVQAFLEHLGKADGEPTEGQAAETPEGKAR